jgi:hypothetical protein
MVRDLVLAGFSPSEALAVMGVAPIEHTGLPSVQLQGIAQVNPENPEAAYEV